MATISVIDVQRAMHSTGRIPATAVTGVHTQMPPYITALVTLATELGITLQELDETMEARDEGRTYIRAPERLATWVRSVGTVPRTDPMLFVGAAAGLGLLWWMTRR